mgnify:CR=1 FL=1
MFKNNHVHSIYKKGKIREERINREDIVEVSQPTIELIEYPKVVSIGLISEV